MHTSEEFKGMTNITSHCMQAYSTTSLTIGSEGDTDNPKKQINKNLYW